jgi:hypothetical protein
VSRAGYSGHIPADLVGNPAVVQQGAQRWVAANLLRGLQVDPRRADAHFCIDWARSPRMRRADVHDQAVASPAGQDRTRYQSALELRPRVAYPHRDLSEGLEVKASRGLAGVRRAQLHGAEQAPAAISERKRVEEEVSG